MKVTVVPAQVTTVEDRIMGSLSFSQMMLVIAPIFLSAGLFAILPPAMGSSVYKFVIMAVIAVLSCTLAIRIKGKILALWLITMLRYNLRPKYYLFNKNTTIYREQYDAIQPDSEEAKKTATTKPTITAPKLDFREATQVLATIENPASKLRFETTKKGTLHVRLTEIEE